MKISIRRTALRAVALLSVMSIGSTALAVGVSAKPNAATAATNPPWEPDANSVGAITFYNSAGQPITSGSTTAAEVAAYDQGTATIQSGDTTATLLAYTPVSGQPPGDFQGGEALSSSTTYPNASAPSALASSSLPLVTGQSSDYSLANYIGDYPNNSTATGYQNMYVLRLKTAEAGHPALTTYDSADIEVTGTTWTLVYPAPTQTSTTTTLKTTPASPQKAGTSVTLTATISPSAPGTVQFETGSTDIGSPVTVSSGTASTSTTTLPVGTLTLSAVFTPTSGSGFASSTGTESYTVTSAGKPTKTKTKLATSPKSPQPPGTSVTLTATVSPVAATGTVQFETGSADIGTPVTVSGGKASTSTTALPTGKDKLSAVFTPSSGTYAASTGKKTFTVKAKKGK